MRKTFHYQQKKLTGLTVTVKIINLAVNCLTFLYGTLNFGTKTSTVTVLAAKSNPSTVPHSSHIFKMKTVMGSYARLSATPYHKIAEEEKETCLRLSEEELVVFEQFNHKATEFLLLNDYGSAQFEMLDQTVLTFLDSQNAHNTTQLKTAISLSFFRCPSSKIWLYINGSFDILDSMINLSEVTKWGDSHLVNITKNANFNTVLLQKILSSRHLEDNIHDVAKILFNTPATLFTLLVVKKMESLHSRNLFQINSAIKANVYMSEFPDVDYISEAWAAKMYDVIWSSKY